MSSKLSQKNILNLIYPIDSRLIMMLRFDSWVQASQFEPYVVEGNMFLFISTFYYIPLSDLSCTTKWAINTDCLDY